MSVTTQILLTPTARLARRLAHEYAQQKTEQGHLAWLPTPIFSFPAWLSQLRETYFLTSDDPRISINAQQAQSLWQAHIDQDVFIGEPQVAQLAQRAWRLIHEHNLPRPATWPELSLSEDSRRFANWAKDYRTACEHQKLIDESAFAAEIPGLVTNGKIPVPDQIEMIGFDFSPTPIQQDILKAFEQAGATLTQRTATDRKPSPIEIVQFEHASDELIGAARWARTRLEANPNQSIAVVVTDLSSRIDSTNHHFRAVFDAPSLRLTETGTEPWHISLGKPLAAWPLVTDALAALGLADNHLSQPQATRLLRSPFLPQAQEQAQARAHILARLALNAPYHLTINELLFAAQREADETLSAHLSAWQLQRKGSVSDTWPSEWSSRFQQELSCLGFGQGRSLDSHEYQALQRWHELLEVMGTIDSVTNSPISRAQAYTWLSQRAQEVVFRERNIGKPVEILGIEEALGSNFDALWITTLDHNSWPGTPQRDPLIPASMQTTVPRATSDGCLSHRQRELDLLMASAPIVMGSFARGSEEVAIEITGLLAEHPCSIAPPLEPPQPADMSANILDEQAPPLTTSKIGGGTSVLRNQSSCPFRAFAERRLRAIDLTPPRPGLNAKLRGIIIHSALENFWQGVGSSAVLKDMSEAQQQQHVTNAVDQALQELASDFQLALTQSGWSLEQRRTERALHRWLAVEKQRDDFIVMGHEQPITLSLAGLTLSGKIDRQDQLADGSTMLIDYKTGRSGKADWFPEPRIADPQLPAYALCMEPQPSAIAFARIRPDELKFDGLTASESVTPGVSELARENRKFKQFGAWSDLLDEWQVHLSALAQDFSAGVATVHPRKSSECNTCHLHSLCRIGERAPDSLPEPMIDDATVGANE